MYYLLYTPDRDVITVCERHAESPEGIVIGPQPDGYYCDLCEEEAQRQEIERLAEEIRKIQFQV